jgi:hypothetical protein
MTGGGDRATPASRMRGATGAVGLGVQGGTSGTASSVVSDTSGGLPNVSSKGPVKVRQEGESKKEWAFCSIPCCGQRM